MYGNTYPAFYYFVVQRQITPAEYQVVEYENVDNENSLIDAREELQSELTNANVFVNWKVLCSASSVEDGYDVINRAIDVDEMLIGNQN